MVDSSLCCSPPDAEHVSGPWTAPLRQRCSSGSSSLLLSSHKVIKFICSFYFPYLFLPLSLFALYSFSFLSCFFSFPDVEPDLFVTAQTFALTTELILIHVTMLTRDSAQTFVVTNLRHVRGKTRSQEVFSEWLLIKMQDYCFAFMRNYCNTL